MSYASKAFARRVEGRPALCHLASAAVAAVGIAIAVASVAEPQSADPLVDPARPAAVMLPVDSYGLAASGGAAAAIAIGR